MAPDIIECRKASA